MTTDALPLLSQAVKRIVADPALPDLTLRQMGVLMHIADIPKGKPGLSTGQIADVFGVQKPAVTRAVQRLAQFDYAVSAPAPMDGRKVEISVTPAGRAFLAKVAKAMRAA